MYGISLSAELRNLHRLWGVRLIKTGFCAPIILLFLYYYYFCFTMTIKHKMKIIKSKQVTVVYAYVDMLKDILK